MTNQPPPDPYGQPSQSDPFGPPPQSDPFGQPPQSGPPHYPSAPGQSSGYPPPGYPPPGYPGQPGYPQPPSAEGTTNVLAILSLVLAFVFWPAGIVLGHIAKKQIAERGEGGAGLATAGLVLSYVFGAITVLSCCGLIGLAIFAESATV